MEDVADCALDSAVTRWVTSARRAGVPDPTALFLMATGAGLLAERLKSPGSQELAALDGVPQPWRESRLYWGRLGPGFAWILDDSLGEPSRDAGTDAGPGAEGERRPAPAWTGGFPCWAAAHAGAVLCVHTSAGGALPALERTDGPDASAGPRPGQSGAPEEPAGAGREAPPAPGTLVLASDHINLSGSTPLFGLGASRLGPLFPDLSRLHHGGLRRAALQRAAKLGIGVREAVVACTQGPSLETPAESRWLALAGAEVCVQGLATPLLSAGHAGLSVLSIVAVAAAAGVEVRLDEVLRRAQATAPALEDLLVSLVPDLAQAAAELAEEP